MVLQCVLVSLESGQNKPGLVGLGVPVALLSFPPLTQSRGSGESVSFLPHVLARRLENCPSFRLCSAEQFDLNA